MRGLRIHKPKVGGSPAPTTCPKWRTAFYWSDGLILHAELVGIISDYEEDWDRIIVRTARVLNSMEHFNIYPNTSGTSASNSVNGGTRLRIVERHRRYEDFEEDRAGDEIQLSKSLRPYSPPTRDEPGRMRNRTFSPSDRLSLVRLACRATRNLRAAGILLSND